MGAFNVRLTTTARKDLSRLSDPVVKRVVALLRDLSVDPFSRQSSKLSARDEYRVRVGDYRIVYAVDKRNKVVVVYRVRHRREVYRRL